MLVCFWISLMLKCHRIGAKILPHDSASVSTECQIVDADTKYLHLHSPLFACILLLCNCCCVQMINKWFFVKKKTSYFNIICMKKTRKMFICLLTTILFHFEYYVTNSLLKRIVGLLSWKIKLISDFIRK